MKHLRRIQRYRRTNLRTQERLRSDSRCGERAVAIYNVGVGGDVNDNQRESKDAS